MISFDFSTGALIGFDEVKIGKAKNTILALNPNAKFAPAPFVKLRVIFTKELSGLIESSECDHAAGVVGSDQTCIFKISPKERRVMRGSFKQKATLFMNFEYSIDGVVQDAKGAYQNYEGTWELTGIIGSGELVKYPELFTDGNGHTITDLQPE